MHTVVKMDSVDGFITSRHTAQFCNSIVLVLLGLPKIFTPTEVDNGDDGNAAVVISVESS